MEIRKFNILDEYTTPKEAIKILLPYLKLNSKIWCPFDDENSNFIKVLIDAGHMVISSHISNGIDFFNTKIKADYIISNPPYSVKDKVLAKLYELDIPFAMLLPSYCIGGNKRYELFKNKELQLLIPKQRISYIDQNGNQTKQCAFHSSYFCYKLLPKQIIFTELEKVK